LLCFWQANTLITINHGRRRVVQGMSAFGTKRTLPLCSAMSASGGKADIPSTQFDVRY
jgi:hypothetical protein